MTEELVRTESMNPAQLLTLAVDKNLDIEKLEKLMQLQREWQNDINRRAYFAALSEFQDQCPDIRRNKNVGFETKGGRTDYNYAPLADIDRQIKKLMKQCGLTKNWKIFDSQGKIKVVCIITHVDGHSESTEMEADADMSGSKNQIQGKGSAIEYMKRYTLIGALGITTADNDIDGRMPNYDVDKLHKEYMELYNQIILKDPKRTAMDPDNWKTERTGKIYVRAIGEARKILADLTNPKP